MENTEKSIKRWLKKKIKLTLATVVMFLITGTISYSLEIKPTDNVWENPKDAIIKEQITIDKSLLSSGITISNEGTIEIMFPENLESTEKRTAIGNGIGFNFNYEDITLNSINNSGIISGKVGEVDFDKNYYPIKVLGNGIRICGWNVKISQIINSGTISGIIGKNIKSLDASGNGLFVQGRGISITKFNNTGEIKGKINSKSDEIIVLNKKVKLSGNGVLLDNSVFSKNNKMEDFDNKGSISGVARIDNFIKYEDIGNGLILNKVYGSNDLPVFKNEGKITGEVINSVKAKTEINYENPKTPDIWRSGNGILVFNMIGSSSKKESYNLGSFDNNGVISGKSKNNKETDYIYGVKRNGNGVFVLTEQNFDASSYAEANVTITDFNNSGFIKGKVENSVSPLALELGNGILIDGAEYAVNDTKGISVTIKNFNNDGLIFGEIKNMNLSGGTRYSGTGILVFSRLQPMVLGTETKGTFFNNKGIISGKTENLITSKAGAIITPGLETGIGLHLEGQNISMEKLNNEGIISGEAKNIKCESEKTFFAGAGNGIYIGNKEDSSKFKGSPEKRKLLIKNLENKGIVSGYFSGDKKEEKYNNGVGILIEKYTGFYTEYYNGPSHNKPYDYNVNIKNIGTVLGNKSGIEIYKTFDYDIFKDKFDTLKEKNFIDNYNNYGLIIGEKPVRFIAHSEKKGDKYRKDFEVSKEYMADKGYVIVLNEDTTVKEVIGTAGNKNKVSLELFADGTTADYTILNTKISEDKKDAYQEFKDENLTNTIINGVGENSGVVTVKGSSSLENGIINAYKTAVSIGDYSEFKGTNVIINGGGLRGSDTETAIIKGTDKNNTLKLAGNVQLNGSIDLGGKDDFDVLSFGENKGVSTTVNIYDEISSAEEINVKDNTNMTLYETAKITGTNKFTINAGSQVTLRVNSLEKDANDGKYKNHALYNDSDKTLFISGDLRKLNDGTIIEEGKDANKYGNVSILNIKTNGLGVNSTIALGNVKFNPKIKDKEENKIDKPGYTQNNTTVWVKTNSILHGAKINETKLENGKYDTNIKIEAEKDLFSIANKVGVIPGKPLGPSTTIIPGMEIIKPGEPGGPTTVIPGMEIIKPGEPGGPITPDKPNIPNKYNNLYVKLNEIYKGVHTSNDRNFNALNDIVTNYTFGDKDKGDYPVIGNEKMQMATLLGYLRSVYAETPYSFSNESTRKSMGLFHDTVRDNNFKAKEDQWLIYGGLVHQSGDQEQTYYGRNYHGFDTGTADTDAEIKLTGAYGQFEYGNTDTLSTGIMVGGTKSDVEVASSKLKGTGAYIGVYAKKDIKDLRLTAGAGYQYTEYDGTRRTINQSYSEDYKDKALNLYLDGKYSYDLGNNLYLVPKAGLSYTHIDQDSIKERKDKALALDVNSKDFDVLEGTVGVDIKKVIPTEKGKHSISAGISYRRILSGDEADYLTANYGGKDFEILVPHKNKGQVSLGARYEVELENGIFYDVKGNYFINTDSKENTNKNADRGEWRVGAGIGYKF